MSIPASELAQIQADLKAACCDKTCVIQRKTTITDDGYGSAQETYTTIATTVAGLEQPSGGELSNYAYMIEDKDAWKVYLPWGTDVHATDHLLIETHTLEVHITLDPHSVPGLLPTIAVEMR